MAAKVGVQSASQMERCTPPVALAAAMYSVPGCVDPRQCSGGSTMACTVNFLPPRSCVICVLTVFQGVRESLSSLTMMKCRAASARKKEEYCEKLSSAGPKHTLKV